MKPEKTSTSKTTPTAVNTIEIDAELARVNPAFVKMVQWLESRTLTEKMTAVLLIALTSSEHEMPGGNVGNEFLNQWEEELFLKPQSGEIGFLSGFCYAVGQIGA